MATHFPLLSFLIWQPIIGAAIILMQSNNIESTRTRYISLITIIISLIACVPLYSGFDVSTPVMQFKEHLAWLPAFGINYALGIDGIALPMILLSTFTTLIVILATWNSIKIKLNQYLAVFLIMQGLMVGVFAATDSILFYFFWEATLIPMFLIIGIWGSTNRFYAAVKFFLYTFIGSALMLIALIYLGFKAGDFSISSFYPLKMGMHTQVLIFIAFLLAFAIKIPMWPVHTWLPDAHTEAPAGGSIILAALMLKMGAYGFLRFSLPIVPDASRLLDDMMLTLSLIAIVYIGFVAIVQRDMKKLIAYSSIAHMGFVTLGIFMVFKISEHTGNIINAALGFEGAMFMMISHAFVSGAMFAGVGFLYERMHTRDINDFGGVVNSMPIFASLFMVIAMANVGLPGTSGFVGEFMVILDSLKSGFWVAFLAATTLILGASYTLWMYKRVFFGAAANDKIAELKDIQGFELTAFSLLVFVVLFFGIYPNALLNIFHSSVGQLLQLAHMTKLS